jgi:O-antigen/teichoic acid export membrane protein
MDAATQIKQRATKSVKWAFLGDLLPKVFQPLFTLVLARLLTPSDYGIIGIAVLVIGLARMVESMGLSQALIQTDEDVEESANVVFWSNLGLSGLLYIILFLTAPFAADFFAEPRVTLVLRIMGLQLVLSAFDDVQEALLRRNFQFQQLVGRRLIPALTPALVSIPLAVAGFGYWSLVAGTLSGTLLGVILLWKVSDWRPRFRFDVRIARLLLGFGAFVAVESLQSWALNYGDNLAVGYFLGIEGLGYYNLGFTLTVILTGYAISPLTSVAYSAFSRLKTDSEELQRLFIDSTRMLAIVVFPLALGLSLAAEPVVSVVLGAKWSGAIPAVRILAIMPGLSWIIVLNPQLYRALGRPDIMPKFHIATLIYIIPAYIISAQFGLIAFCLSRASVGFVFYIPHIWLSIKMLKLSRWYFWDCIRSPLSAGLIMSGMVFVLASLLRPYSANWQEWGKLIIILMGGAISYSLALWLIDRSLCLRAIQLVRKMIG